jgi:lysyl-tRNA synthetase class I
MEDVRQEILEMSLEELENLLSWLKAVVKARKQEQAVVQPIPLKQGREVLETRSAGTVTYRLEKVKCGKKKCKCAKGKLHGPYWYAYHWNGKKLASTYIGKTFRAAITSE